MWLLLHIFEADKNTNVTLELFFKLFNQNIA